KTLDRVLPDTVEKDRVRAELHASLLTNAAELERTAANVIMAEAGGESWLQRNWRPMLMVLFGLIIANNFLVVPIFNTPTADIPPDMWDLLKLGLGGYVLGRSAEKGIRVWKG
ncbi:MAG: holin family protein, partial [Rhodospirillaceae bacterium]|nr:holin family protein [Rhodospirillaceae bacterium]